MKSATSLSPARVDALVHRAVVQKREILLERHLVLAHQERADLPPSTLERLVRALVHSLGEAPCRNVDESVGHGALLDEAHAALALIARHANRIAQLLHARLPQHDDVVALGKVEHEGTVRLRREPARGNAIEDVRDKPQPELRNQCETPDADAWVAGALRGLFGARYEDAARRYETGTADAAEIDALKHAAQDRLKSARCREDRLLASLAYCAAKAFSFVHGSSTPSAKSRAELAPALAALAEHAPAPWHTFLESAARGAKGAER